MHPAKVANYVSPRGAQAYKADYENKLQRKLSDRMERRIFARFFRTIGRCGSILDIPCGVGRLFSLLQLQADRVYEADFSPTMLSLNASEHGGKANAYVRCSALAMPLPDRAMDTVISVRLNHHLNRVEDRERHLREVFRVAEGWAIATFFSHDSIKNRIRRLRARFDNKSPKLTLRPARVVEIARESGFDTLDLVSISRLSSGHLFGLFRRRPG